jgi:hypothetical protein
LFRPLVFPIKTLLNYSASIIFEDRNAITGDHFPKNRVILTILLKEKVNFFLFHVSDKQKHCEDRLHVTGVRESESQRLYNTKVLNRGHIIHRHSSVAICGEETAALLFIGAHMEYISLQGHTLLILLYKQTHTNVP